MSTRAIYTFTDPNGTYHVYKHHDGYPTGAAKAINAALNYAWPLPRFEADEFAASFVAANKHLPDPTYPTSQGGGVRLLQSGSEYVAPGDIEYRYEIYQGNDRCLRVKVLSTNYWGDNPSEEILFDCRLTDLAKAAARWERVQSARERAQ